MALALPARARLRGMRRTGPGSLEASLPRRGALARVARDSLSSEDVANAVRKRAPAPSTAAPCSRSRTPCIASLCRAFVAAGVLMLLAGAGAQESARAVEGTLTLEALMHHLATTSGVRAEFHEVKEIALLERPLESDGTIYFVPPRRMARYTTKPTRSAFVLDGPHLSFRDETGHENVDLSEHRIARTIIDNLVVLFNGDLEALRARYDVGFEAQGSRWKLDLVPRDSRVRSVVSRVVLRGDDAALEQMVVSEAGGDRTVTTFHDVRNDVRFSEAELARIFSLDPNAPPP